MLPLRGMLCDATGAWALGPLAALEVFWRAMFDNASKMDWVFSAMGMLGWPAAAAGALPWREANGLGGGLPGGVVEVAVRNRSERGQVKGLVRGNGLGCREGDVRAASLSRNDLISGAGNVEPFSQMSNSFFIFSYTQITN